MHSTTPAPLTRVEGENPAKLAALLDDVGSHPERLLKAEIYRAFGDFARAEEVLARKFPQEFEAFAEALRALVARRVTELTQIG